jgi:hypothetical protein
MFKSNDIDKRIHSKISQYEFAAMIFVFLFALYFLITESGNYGDYRFYLATAEGDLENYYYGYWLLPLFKFLVLIPFKLGYIFWITISIIGVWFASRVFNGNSILAILSYQMSYALFWGQISGIICGFLGLFWWALHHRKWNLAGFAILIAAAKPQSGGLFIFILWLLADISWRNKARVLIIPFIGFSLSLLFYPGWILEVLSRMDGLYTWGNISLTQWVGFWSLLLFIPAIFLPMKRENRYLVLVSVSILASPYFLHTDLLTLFIFPIGLIPILLGYLPGIMLQFIGYAGQPSGIIVPIFVVLLNIVPIISIIDKKHYRSIFGKTLKKTKM